MAVIYPQNGDLTMLLKSGRKEVPQSARLSAGGGALIKKGLPLQVDGVFMFFFVPFGTFVNSVHFVFLLIFLFCQFLCLSEYF